MRKKPITYRVDMKVPTTGLFVPYTHKKGTDLGMATSLASHLKRSKTAGRLVEMPTEIVMDEWDTDGNKITTS